MNPYYLSPQQVETLRALPIVEKKAACIYEAFRFAINYKYTEQPWSMGRHSKLYKLLKANLQNPELPNWLDLPAEARSSLLELTHSAHFSSAEVLSCGSESEKRAISKRLTVFDGNGPPDEEPVLAVRIDWSSGLNSIMDDLRRQLEKMSHEITPGANGRPDPRCKPGVRILDGELDPVFLWIAVTADLATTGGNKSETARRMQVERKTVRDSVKRLSKKLLEWFEVSPSE